MSNDYYKVLDVERNASADEISKAYRKLARKFHPDHNPDDKNAKKRFQEVQQAYDCLNDPEKRKMYDQFGANYEQYGGKNPVWGWGNLRVAVGSISAIFSVEVVSIWEISLANSGAEAAERGARNSLEAPTSPLRLLSP